MSASKGSSPSPDSAIPAARERGKALKRHGAVGRYIKHRDWQFVSENLVERAADVIQAIAEEAEKRGFTANTPAKGIWTRPYSSSLQRSHILIRTPAGLYSIRIQEVPGPGAAKKSPHAWTQPKSLPAWEAARAWEFIPTGKLELRVHGPEAKYDGDRYRDSLSRLVEARIPEVFDSFERYAVQIEERETRREQEAERRRSANELAKERAEEARYQEALRRALDQQLEDWERTKKAAAFLAEMAPAIAAIEDDAARSKALEWSEWIQGHIEETNPLGKALTDPPLHKTSHGGSDDAPRAPGARDVLDHRSMTKWRGITPDGEPRPNWSSFSK